jgi:hypothetical protein
MEREEGEKDPCWITTGIRDEGALSNEFLIPLGESEDGATLIPRARTVIGSEVDDPVRTRMVFHPLGRLTMGEAEENHLYLIKRSIVGQYKGKTREDGRSPCARARGGKDHLDPVVMGENAEEFLPRITISPENADTNAGGTGGSLRCVHPLIYAKVAPRVNVGPGENGAMRDRCRSRRATRSD